MFFDNQESKVIEALSVLAAALDNPRKQRREVYIKAALFIGTRLFTDFLEYSNKSQIFHSHE